MNRVMRLFRAAGGRAGWLIAAMLLLPATVAVAGVVETGPTEPSGPPGPTLPIAEPRIPISQLPYIIAAGGSYFVTGDLVLPPGSDDTTSGISIQASNVTLDLNGFTVRGINNVSPAVISAAGGVRNVTLRNGAVADARNGIDFTDAFSSRISHVTVRDYAVDGIDMGPSSVVEDCNLAGGGGNNTGITLGFRSIARNCTVSDHGGFGIHAAVYAIVEGSTVTGNGASCPSFCGGISVEGHDATIRDNDLDNVGPDILIAAGDPASILDNTVTGCASIVVAPGGSAVVFRPLQGQPHSNVTRSAGFCP